MSLTRRTKILTGCGRNKICLKFWTWHFQNFMALLNIWPQMKVLFCTKKGSFSNIYLRNTNVVASRFTNYVMRLDTSMIWHFMWAKTDSELHSTWPQIMWQYQDKENTRTWPWSTVRPYRKGMPQDLGPQKMTLKHGDLQVQTRGDLTAIQLRDKCNIHMLTNIHDVLADMRGI